MQTDTPLIIHGSAELRAQSAAERLASSCNRPSTIDDES